MKLVLLTDITEFDDLTFSHNPIQSLIDSDQIVRVETSRWQDRIHLVVYFRGEESPRTYHPVDSAGCNTIYEKTSSEVLENFRDYVSGSPSGPCA